VRLRAGASKSSCMAIIQKQGWLNRSTAPGGNLD